MSKYDFDYYETFVYQIKSQWYHTEVSFDEKSMTTTDVEF